jgi:CheY-like chemotaxis protein
MGLEMARLINPGLIFCDAHMPGLSGPELLALLKADEATAGIPVVMMSGAAVDCAGAAGVLQKPFTFEQLRDEAKRLARIF